MADKEDLKMITSAQNPKVKYLLKLKSKSGFRKSEGLYMAEGVRMFKEAPIEDTEQVFASASFERDEKEGLLSGREYEVLSDDIFKKICATMTPQGVLCLMRMKTLSVPKVISGKTAGLWLLLEGIQDPGNLGTMLRTGEAAGVGGIIMDENTVDIYNPKVIRSTMGSIFRVPFAKGDLKEAAYLLKRSGDRIYAACAKGQICYDEADYSQGTAFLIGNEGSGLTQDAVALSDDTVSIPMCGKTESLNASMSAGILLYEAARQRRAAEKRNV